MNQPANQKKVNSVALAAVKNRFYQIPSNNNYPKFKDIETLFEQANPGILLHYYHKCGGSDSNITAQFLLDTLDFLYGETFQPLAPRITNDRLNLWSPSKFQFSGTSVSENGIVPFMEILERWFPKNEERDYFIWWLAHTVRKPNERKNTTLLLRSEHGVGKGFLCESLLSSLVGSRSVAQCSLKDVVGDFNDIVEGKTLLVVDEVYHSKSSTANAMKSIQASNTLALRRKHKPTITIDNYLNFIITSNSHIPVVIEKDDRRFWVPEFMKHKHSQNETAIYINNRLKPWLNNGGYQMVRDWLETIDLSQYRATSPAPMTQAKKEILGFTTEDKISELIASIIESETVVTISMIKDRLTASFSNIPSDVTIASTLMGQGCIRKQTNARRYYITPNGLASGLSTSTTPKELENHLMGSF